MSSKTSKRLYLVCQFSEVLLCVVDHISHPEDWAVGVVVLVKVTFFDVIISDVRKEVPSAKIQTEPCVSTPDFMIIHIQFLLKS